MQTLYCTHHRARIPVTKWDQHLEQIDYTTAESYFLEEIISAGTFGPATSAGPPHQVLPGSFCEIVDIEALDRLMEDIPKPSTTTSLDRIYAPQRPTRSATHAQRKQYAEDLKKWSARSTKDKQDAKNLKMLEDIKSKGRRNDTECTLSLEITYRRMYTVGRDVVVEATRSLQLCPKAIRGPLAATIYHDLDMENCHYMIMVQIAESHEVDLMSVRHYVDNRDECLQRVRSFYDVTRKAAKDLFLSILNGGGTAAWMRKFGVDVNLIDDLAHDRSDHPDIIRKLKREYQTIRDVMFDRYSDHVASLIVDLKRDKPQLPTRFDHVHQRTLPAED
eukprot:COSAG02_NODE_15558_length_1160_cov_1.367578_1_plen_332_part_10